MVTAAGQGIGKASALAMAAQGAQVWATDLNPKLLDAYDGVQGIHAVTLDVLDKAAIARVAATLPPLDVLFNCAGFVHNGTIEQATDDEWEFAFNLNVRAQFWMIQAVLPGMLAKGGGSIIQPLHLRHLQGGRGRPDQERGSRLCGARHSLQCHRARHGGHALAGRAHQFL